MYIYLKIYIVELIYDHVNLLYFNSSKIRGYIRSIFLKKNSYSNVEGFKNYDLFGSLSSMIFLKFYIIFQKYLLNIWVCNSFMFNDKSI